MAEQKVALITAGGSGMGAEAASRLHADGFKIGILSSSGKGESLAAKLGGIGVAGSNQLAYDLQKLIDGALERWGRIDVLVNSAGHGPRKPILAVETPNINIPSTASITAPMLKARSGSI